MGNVMNLMYFSTYTSTIYVCTASNFRVSACRYFFVIYQEGTLDTEKKDCCQPHTHIVVSTKTTAPSLTYAMLRRALSKFCLPCGGEAQVDNVSDFDPDTEYFRPKDFHVVQARVRAQRYSELMSQWEAYFRKLHTPPPSEYRWVEASHWLRPAVLVDSQQQGVATQQERQRGGDSVKESEQSGDSIQKSQVAMAESFYDVQPEEGTGVKDPAARSFQMSATSSRSRGCSKCWEKRMGVGPRRFDKLGFPLPQIPPV